MTGFFEDLYDKHYKGMVFASFAFLLICVLFLGYTKLTTGEFIDKGISLKGGLSVTIFTDIPASKVSSYFEGSDSGVRTISEGSVQKALIVESSELSEEEVFSRLKQAGIDKESHEYTTEFIGSSLGVSFYKQTIRALFIAFIGIAIVVFVTFRNALPSFFIILCAVSDILATLAVLSFLGVKLSTAGIAAFLMMIGYSVDSDIMLTTRVLKRKEGSVNERIVGAMKTGLTMSATSFCAALVGFIFTQSDVIKQIMLVLFVGMVCDVIFTWLQNASILKWYLKRLEKQ